MAGKNESRRNFLKKLPIRGAAVTAPFVFPSILSGTQYKPDKAKALANSWADEIEIETDRFRVIPGTEGVSDIAWDPTGSFIYFNNRTTDEGWDLCAMSPDGTGIRPFFTDAEKINLTRKMGEKILRLGNGYKNLSFSSNGRRLAYADRNNIYIIDLTGENAQGGFPIKGDTRRSLDSPSWIDDDMIVFSAGAEKINDDSDLYFTEVGDVKGFSVGEYGEIKSIGTSSEMEIRTTEMRTQLSIENMNDLKRIFGNIPIFKRNPDVYRQWKNTDRKGGNIVYEGMIPTRTILDKYEKRGLERPGSSIFTLQYLRSNGGIVFIDNHPAVVDYDDTRLQPELASPKGHINEEYGGMHRVFFIRKKSYEKDIDRGIWTANLYANRTVDLTLPSDINNSHKRLTPQGEFIFEEVVPSPDGTRLATIYRDFKHMTGSEDGTRGICMIGLRPKRWIY
ncbi:MAG: hypothetical protein JW754_03720 [Candidatus Aenigmarchaeota archaeon]|nr:hypothetical protein [Candidatus Aenigmarchaeota archaeon]